MRTNFLTPLVLIVIATSFVATLPAEDDDPFSEPKNPPTQKKSGEKKKKGPLIIVSKETTRIEGPLTKDGYVDYLEALNQHCSRGVTPQNNAAVLFWKALGPGPIEEETLRKPFFKKLGIEPLPEEGDYFVSLEKYLQRKGNEDLDFDEMCKKLNAAMEKPWKKMDRPNLADWLAENEKPLKAIIAGTRRPKYYNPLVVKEGASPAIVSILLLGPQQHREVARALCARAMAHLEEGKIDKAWEDLMACRRLGQKLGEGATLVDSLVGIAIDGDAMKGQTVLAHLGKLNAKQAAKYLADLRRLGSVPKIVDKIDIDERYMYLDAVSFIAHQEPGEFDYLSDLVDDGTGKIINLFRAVAPDAIDWNETLRVGNRWYDKLIATVQQPTRARRMEALKKFNEELENVYEKSSDPIRMALALVFSNRKTRGRMIGEVISAMYLPPVDAMADDQDRDNARRLLTQLAFALEAYRADRDEYPDSLDKLKPKYLAEIPKDTFTGKPLTYRNDKDGYLLYSFGPNGEDNEGVIDWTNSHFDDISIRVPIKP